VRLVSWNVAGRVRTVPEQAARIARARPDLVCLQEVTIGAAPLWEHALRSLGLEPFLHPAAWSETEPRKRRLAVVTGVRGRVAHVGGIEGVPWPERALVVQLDDGLELVNLHSPISQTPKLVKVRTHEAVHAYLSGRADCACVLCGDLNTPRREHPDGRVWTFARDRYGRLRPERGERWDAAELALIRGLEPLGFRDAFRTLHGYGEREPSWEWPRWGGGYRLDHLIVSADVSVGACHYEHGWRRAGLSDHSALLAEISPRTCEPGASGTRAAGHPGSAAGS
jgi:exonuclease III